MPTFEYVQYDPVENDLILFKGQSELGPDGEHSDGAFGSWGTHYPKNCPVWPITMHDVRAIEFKCLHDAIDCKSSQSFGAFMKL